MLIQTSQEVVNVSSVSTATDFDRISPFCAQAELQFIMPMLGSDMYAALIAYYKNESNYRITSDLKVNNFIISHSGSGDDPTSGHTPHENAWALLLYYTQRSIVHLAYYMGFDTLNAYVSDAGFRRTESEGIKPLFKYQEDNLKKFFRATGIDTLDVILEILETRIQFFDAYKTQLYKHKGRIIYDTKTFSDHYFISNSRIIFDRLRQHMKTTEELYLIKVVGKENFNYILAEIQKENPAAKVSAILPYLRDPLAWISTAMLMEESGAELTERGLYLKGLKNLNNSDLEINTDDARVRELISRNYARGDEYLMRLKLFLTENASDWNQYSNPRSGLHNRDNTDKRTFWA